MEKLKFKNGDEMPVIGLGTWKSKKGKVEAAVKTALQEGYRHIDCAATYGNETEVGEAFNKIFSEGKIKRKEVWITSKLWNNAHKEEDVIPALKKTLQDLQLDYLDLYLIHWPVAFKPGVAFPETDNDFLSLEEAPLIETWNAMVEAKKQGLVRHIGVSNFSEKKLTELMEETPDLPEMNQVELHPFLQQPQLMDFCKTNDILVTAFSPLGSGDRIKELKAKNEPSLLENPTIKKIAEKHHAQPAQVLIKWSVTRGTAVIPKSIRKDRIVSNLKSTEIQLDDDDMKQMAKLDKGFRYVTGKFYVTPGNPYKNIYDE